MDDSSFGTYRELAVWQKALRLVKLVYVQIEKFRPERFIPVSWPMDDTSDFGVCCWRCHLEVAMRFADCVL